MTRLVREGWRICRTCREAMPLVAFTGDTDLCKHCRSEDKMRARTNKLAFMAYKGGKCIVCGYNKCPAAMQFHHVDPSTKLFEIKSNRPFKTQKAELDKCVLLCANCHKEVHAGVVTL